MDISAEKTKLMTNNSGISTKIKANGQKLETVTSSKFLDLVISDEGSKHEIPPRTEDETAALKGLKPVSQFQDMTDAFPCHIHLPV